MNNQVPTPSESMDQAELAVRADQVSQFIAGCCIAASLLLLLAIL